MARGTRKKNISEKTESRHFVQNLNTKLVCDVPNPRLGAALKQYSFEGWVLISYASRLLKSEKEKYSSNELELLGIVCLVEQFEYYLYGKALPSLQIIKSYSVH